MGLSGFGNLANNGGLVLTRMTWFGRCRLQTNFGFELRLVDHVLAHATSSDTSSLREESDEHSQVT
jgi:hypothetical protein